MKFNSHGHTPLKVFVRFREEGRFLQNESGGSGEDNDGSRRMGRKPRNSAIHAHFGTKGVSLRSSGHGMGGSEIICRRGG